MLALMSLESNGPSKPATTVEHSSGAIDPGRELVLSRDLHAQIVTHLAEWLPNEGCGLLASIPDGPVDRVIHFFPGTNIDRSPVRFTMEPAEVVDAIRQIREEGWTLAAILHSHPRSQAVPSRTDLREAYYPQARLLIVSFSSKSPEFGCWVLANDLETRGVRRASLRIEGR